ncbi:MAG: ester cyclase [Cohaesibacter sp.]|jgi:predicted SnoaL-like aldol condensation-catalyzing enzyme|nr:ester cyclase [Cohaesibacter sp.]
MSTSDITKPRIHFDRLKQDHWTELEASNAAVVVDFFQHLMNEHDFDYILQTFGDAPYIQHNRAIPPEISGVVEYVRTLTKRFPDYSYDVKRVVASGDIVVLHSHVTLKAKHRGNEGKGFIITDTFRLEEGKLREHWDAMQAIDLFTRFLMLLTGGTIANRNPTF